MIIQPLSAEESWAGDFTHTAIITFADLAAAPNGNTLTVPIETAPKGTLISNFAIHLFAPFVFSDVSLISSAITIGDGGSATKYLASTELNNAGAFVNYATLQSLVAYNVATQYSVFFTATAAKNLNTATAGELHLFWTRKLLSQLSYPQWD